MTRAVIKSSLLLTFFFFINVVFCSSLIKHELILAALFLLIVFLFRFWDLAHCMIYFFLLVLFSFCSIYYLLNLPAPIPLFMPLFISTLLVLPLASTRKTLSWLKLGSLDRGSWILILVTGFGSVVALIVWALWTDNLGLGVRMVQSMADYPLWLLAVFGIPLFALANAFVEEAICRGIVQEAAARTFGNPAVVLVLQSTVFAALHFQAGFPMVSPDI
jgi:membrane protease YdiL (CAAX protease family)